MAELPPISTRSSPRLLTVAITCRFSRGMMTGTRPERSRCAKK